MIQQPSGHEPCYIISVAARLVGVHPQTLRYYENVGLVKPARSPGNKRLYSPNDIDRLREIHRLTGEAGVNLAGVETILRLLEEIARMRAEMTVLQERFESEGALSRSRLGPAE